MKYFKGSREPARRGFFLLIAKHHLFSIFYGLRSVVLHPFFSIILESLYFGAVIATVRNFASFVFFSETRRVFNFTIK